MNQPKWLPAALGAEPKKVGVLVVLLALLGYVFFFNGDDVPAGASTSTSTTNVANTATPATASGSAAGQRIVQTAPPARRVRRQGGAAEGFEPTLLLDEDFDVSQVDPTLKLALLDRVRSVGNVGGRRSLFEFYTPPPPPPAVKDITPEEREPPPPPKPVESKPATSVKAPPTPIPLKYYGYTGNPEDARRHGLFLDGEDILVASEGDLVEDRYRIQRIGLTSVEVTDVVQESTQTLPIVEELGPEGR